MYLLVAEAKAQPGKADELGLKWRDFFGGRALPGVQRAYFAVDRATDTTQAVAVWSEKPDETLVRQMSQEFGSQVRDLVAQPPSPKLYEVLQEI